MSNLKEYPAMTRSRMDCLRQNLAAKGVTLPGTDNATVEYLGVKLSINYDEPQQVLRIDIVQKPGLMPESLIWGFVDTVVKQCP